jgi:hypothetical protein
MANALIEDPDSRKNTLTELMSAVIVVLLLVKGKFGVSHEQIQKPSLSRALTPSLSSIFSG